jgi:asparagine N-glycosylation enzyme membrane subunit Stt3
MVQNGLFSPYLENNGQGWINYQQWYPDGLNMGRSLPALPMTTAALYIVISWLGVNIDLMSFAALFPAIIGALSCLIIYFIEPR